MEDQTFETKDIITASYLRYRGHYCIGTVPAKNRYKPAERKWLFERTDEVLADVEAVKGGDPNVPIKDIFYCRSILMNLLNDKDD